MRRLRVLAALVALTAVQCSLLNREGPDVDCTDLRNGAMNACQEGIIASCSNGDVTYEVCDDTLACDASWQQVDRYRCESTDPLPAAGSGGGSSGGSGGVGAGGGAGSGDCGPTEKCVVATNDQAITAYAVANGRLYFANHDSIHSVPVTGGFPTVLASGLKGAGWLGHIAVDSQHVYVVERDYPDSGITRVPLGGGTVETVVAATSFEEVDAVAIGGDYIYWSGRSDIYRKPKLGGAREEVVENEFSARKLVVEGDHLYWTSSTTLRRVSTTGSLPASPASISLGHNAADFAVNSTHVFFVSTVSELVAKYPLAGGSLIELATDQRDADHVTIDTNWVYYAPSHAGWPSDIRKVNQQGGAPRTVATTTTENVDLGRIVVDETHVYWTEGSIWRAPK